MGARAHLLARLEAIALAGTLAAPCPMPLVQASLDGREARQAGRKDSAAMGR